MVDNAELARMMKAFGKRLRAARIVANYKNADLFAKKLELEPPTYRKYERGQAWPPLDVLARIVELTNQTTDFLLLGRKP